MFRDLELLPVYTSDDNDIAKEFYNPVLKQAVTFDRTSAYFSARALAMYAEGLECFGNQGLKYRLIISKDISLEDYEQIKNGYNMREEITSEMLELLRESLTEGEEQKISNLAYFIACGVVDIKIAFKKNGIFHDKCGIVSDQRGDIICFRGSNNETEAAVNYNYESFQVICSWLDVNGFYLAGIKKSQEEFEKLWNNEKEDIIVLPAQQVVINEIIKYNKGKVIVEEVLLKKDTIILDYDGQLILHINTDSIEWLLRKAFYKSRIKHKVFKIENNIIYFDTDLAYPDYVKMDELLSRKIPLCGYQYYTTERLRDYIQARNLYIDKREKLGIELKTDAARLDERYQKFKEIVNQRMERKLRNKQMQDAFFMFAMSKSGNFSVPGSGKTSSALAVYSFLKANGLVDRIVMIGPKNAFGSWIDEFQACFGKKEQLRYFNIQDSKYKTPNDKRLALKYETANSNLFLINYEGVASCIDEICHIVSQKSLLVFDEVHKVKAINGQRAQRALEISKWASYIIAMTGTPIPNTYMDLYNLLHILYNDEYKDFFGFDISFLRNPLPTEMEIINDRIQPFFCRTTKKELQVPDPNADELIRVSVTEEEQKIFDILRMKYRNNALALFVRLLQLESNPHMLLQTLDISEFKNVLDITDDIDDIDYVDYSCEIRKNIENMGLSSKKRQCINKTCDLVREGKTVIIWCIFKDSIRSIQKMLLEKGIKAEYIMGEVELEDRTQLISDFRNGKFDVLITNPHTLAESVSLHTVCHDAIYFEYSYNLVHLLQSKDRIHRLGLPSNQYTQYYYMQDFFKHDEEMFSMDEKIYLRLQEKEKIMLDAIDNQELEPVYTPEEDLQIIFGNLL